jgi:hypothetical protein
VQPEVKATRLPFGVATVAMLAACVAVANGGGKMAPGAVDDAAFFSLELPSWTPASTTPEMGDDERGLRIAAPKEVPVGDDMTLPISVIASFDAEVWNALPPRLWPHLVAVVQDGQGRQLVARNLGDTTPIPGESKPAPLLPEAAPKAAGPAPEAEEMPDVPFPSDPPDEAPAGEPSDDAPVLEASSAIGYYNFDLLQVADLPRRAGTEYVVFLSYARFHSNSVRVRFVPPRS